MKTIIYTFIMALSCYSYAASAPAGNDLQAGDEMYLKMAALSSCSAVGGCPSMCAPNDLKCLANQKPLTSFEVANSEEVQLPPAAPQFQVIKAPMQCVCIKTPCNCNPPSPPSPQNNDSDELGMSMGGMVSSLSSTTPQKPTCMCVKAPCNCPMPPSASSEATANNDEDSFNLSMESNLPKKLVCEDGRMYKLAYPANPPAGCSWQNANSIEDENEFGLAIGEMISSSALPKSTQKAGTCMCIKAPCNCPQPPAPTKEVEELY